MRQPVKQLIVQVTTDAPPSELDDPGIAVRSPGIRVISVPDLAEDVLRRSGIEPGMRVLELDCGNGNGSFAIARLIGPSGLVVGVDRSQQAIDIAERRATVAGYCYWTRFVTADPDTFVPHERFDAAVVRLELLRQGDCAAFLRLSACVRPGGVVLLLSSKRNVTTIEPSVSPIDRNAGWVKMNEWRSLNVFGAAAAFVSSGLAPALLITAIWSGSSVAPTVFACAFVGALGHAVLLGLPTFLIFRSRGWAGIRACVVFGFAIGAVPACILTFPESGFALLESAWARGAPGLTDGLGTAAVWISYVQPLIYFGLLGAFGGIAFWAVLTCSDYAARYASMRFLSCALHSHSSASFTKSDSPNGISAHSMRGGIISKLRRGWRKAIDRIKGRSSGAKH